MKRKKKEEITVLVGVAVISFIAAISSLSRVSSGGHSRGLFGLLELLLNSVLGPYSVPAVMTAFGVFSLVLAFFSWRE